MKNKKIFLLVFILAFIVFTSIYYINSYRIEKQISELDTENIIIENNTIEFDSLTLEQKISQMIMVRGDEKDLDFTGLNAGGFFLDSQKSQEDYRELAESYKNNPRIKPFIATDLEGAWNPFDNSVYNSKPYVFPSFSDINTSEQAYNLGLEHGRLLDKTGFNMNFAPVAEYTDDVYGGRAFSGTDKEIKKKIEFYIKGLQENVLGTCKHYPGKGMQKNLHYVSDKENISSRDLELFYVCLKNNISSFMIGHQVVRGEVNSDKKPSSVSNEVINSINDSVLIISDEVNMRGLSNFYDDKTQMYIDLINSGENLILDFDLTSKELYKLVKDIKKEVEKGNIKQKRINNSVRKILEVKGYEVV